jgi:hypothetical protein
MLINFRVRIQKTMRIFGVLIALTFAVGCGGEPVNCHPVTIQPCVAHSAGACDSFSDQGQTWINVACSGGDAYRGCEPGDHRVCQDTCDQGLGQYSQCQSS